MCRRYFLGPFKCGISVRARARATELLLQFHMINTNYAVIYLWMLLCMFVHCQPRFDTKRKTIKTYALYVIRSTRTANRSYCLVILKGVAAPHELRAP